LPEASLLASPQAMLYCHLSVQLTEDARRQPHYHSLPFCPAPCDDLIMSTRAAALPVPQSDPRGLAAACGAFFIWGLLPLYLKWLQAVPVLQVTAHRLTWGCVFALAWLGLRGELRSVAIALAQPATRVRLFASAALISINWVTYVWGVANDRVVETSLGYFINPLFNVLLGVVLLSERLNRAQWTAVGIAGLGVAWLTWIAGHPPWISLILAFTFGMYGFVRKVIQVDALAGLGAETLLLLPLGIGYLIWCGMAGTGSLGHTGLGIDILLVLGGPLTAIPLVLFAYGARRIPYSTVGLLQYIGPTMQLLLGVFAFHEPFGGPRLIGFALIWTALAIYAIDGLWRSRRGTA
jgi:chloramphenicol-sensitive protein RarD